MLTKQALEQIKKIIGNKNRKYKKLKITKRMYNNAFLIYQKIKSFDNYIHFMRFVYKTYAKDKKIACVIKYASDNLIFLRLCTYSSLYSYLVVSIAVHLARFNSIFGTSDNLIGTTINVIEKGTRKQMVKEKKKLIKNSNGLLTDTFGLKYAKIYKIFSPSNPQDVYIGRTIHPFLRSRIYEHLGSLKKAQYFGSSKVLKHNDWTFKCIDTPNVTTLKELNKIEKEYIKKMGTVNIIHRAKPKETKSGLTQIDTPEIKKLKRQIYHKNKKFKYHSEKALKEINKIKGKNIGDITVKDFNSLKLSLNRLNDMSLTIEQSNSNQYREIITYLTSESFILLVLEKYNCFKRYNFSLIKNYHITINYYQLKKNKIIKIHNLLTKFKNLEMKFINKKEQVSFIGQVLTLYLKYTPYHDIEKKKNYKKHNAFIIINRINIDLSKILLLVDNNELNKQINKLNDGYYKMVLKYNIIFYKINRISIQIKNMLKY